jgi:hypothetical protein
VIYELDAESVASLINPKLFLENISWNLNVYLLSIVSDTMY